MAILVRGLETREGGGFFDCSARVTLDGREREMTFRRSGTHPDLARRKDTFDPFAVALLVPAMLRGEPLVIEGDIDEFLLVSLRGLVQASFRLMLRRGGEWRWRRSRGQLRRPPTGRRGRRRR
jgi:hypothetical protein